MLRTYITIMPLQRKKPDGSLGGLNTARYAPETSSIAQDTITTSFPIRQVMRNTLQEGDTVKIIAIVLKNEDTDATLNLFRAELAEELSRVNLSITEADSSTALSEKASTDFTDANFITITIPENQSTNNLLRACRELIAALPETSQAHACLTFGTKPVSFVALCALSCAERMKRELELGGTYYGEIKRNQAKPVVDADGITIATLYDTTAFYRLSNIISQIDNCDTANALFGHLLDMRMAKEEDAQ